MGRFSLARATPAPAPAAPEASAVPAAATAPAEAGAPATRVASKPEGPPRDANLDPRLRLHSRLIDELDLAKLDKLEESELRRQVLSQVIAFSRDERLALISKE